MLPILIFFSVGLGILLLSSQLFLNTSQNLAAKWRLSPLFISIFILAFGTTLPELTVTTIALFNQDSGLATGNLIGSSIVNISLIFGLATFAGAVRIGTTKTPKNAIVLFLVAGLLISVTTPSFIALNSTISAMILLFALLTHLLYQYFLAMNGRAHEDKKLLSTLSRVLHHGKNHSAAFYILSISASVLGVVLGGHLSVHAVEELATLLKLSTTFLGLTLTSIATSLPELVLALIASHKRNNQDNKLLIGTLIGSSIINLTLFPALILLSSQKLLVTAEEKIILFLTMGAFLLIVLTYRGRVVSKIASLLLILLFAVFLILIPRA